MLVKDISENAKNNALSALHDIIKKCTDTKDKALVYYEIWELTKEETDRQQVLNLYQQLYLKHPKYEYQMFIAKLIA